MSTRSSGFTLIELLVSLAVFSLILIGLTQGVHFGLLTSYSAARIGAENANLSEIDLAIRHLVEAMLPQAEDTDRPALLAGRNEMTFLTDLPRAAQLDSGESASARHIEATLLVDGRHRLVLRWQPVSDSDHVAPTKLTETVILRGVSHLDLAFWRRAGGWTDSWRSTELPAMVRIRVSFADDRSRHWPEIVSAPLLDRP